jgi:hypothetical protein
MPSVLDESYACSPQLWLIRTALYMRDYCCVLRSLQILARLLQSGELLLIL